MDTEPRRDLPVPVRVEFTLPPSGPTVRADASVVWVSCPEAEKGRLSEIGVHFSDVEDSVRQQLAEYAIQPINRRR